MSLPTTVIFAQRVSVWKKGARPEISHLTGFPEVPICIAVKKTFPCFDLALSTVNDEYGTGNTWNRKRKVVKVVSSFEIVQRYIFRIFQLIDHSRNNYCNAKT